MNPLHISGYGTHIKVDKRRLIIKNESQGLSLEFYPHQIDQDLIVIDGHTGDISFEAIRWLSKHDIQLVVLNWNGNLLANMLPKEPNNGKLRVKQYQKYLDQEARYNIALKITEEKIAKSIHLLKELSRYHSEIDIGKVEEAVREQRELYDQAHSMDVKKGVYEINKLMGLEGGLAMMYWDNLSLVFNKLYPEFNFKSRKNKSYSWNMNASDEINALLNYGYAILESQARRCINTAGLDLCVGYLHEMVKGKTPLVFDVQELYRWIVDLSVIELLEEKKLKKSDFITTENYHIRLRPETAKMLLDKMRINFNSKKLYMSKNVSLDTIYMYNVQILSNYIQGKQSDLALNVPCPRIQRMDTKDTVQKILDMSVQDARDIGLNKSTLWYIKQNIKKGKKVELYQKVKIKIL